ncbi:MAG: AbrB/MazE/SpoVT family DNA-binding domain-containing protein [Petrotogales bacterium]
MKIETKVHQMGSGIAIYIPAKVRKNLDIEAKDTVYLDTDENGDLIVTRE